jgi:hypothetical protein
VIHYGGNSSQHAGNTFTAVMIPEATWRFFRKTRGVGYASAYRTSMCVSALIRLGLIQFTRWSSNAAVACARQSSGDKWLAILRWTLGIDGVVSQYYGPAR